MAGLYITIILLCRVVQAVFNKRSSNEITSLPMMVKYNAYQNTLSAILGLALIVVAGSGFACDLKTVLIAAFSGITLFFSIFCSIYAMKSGTVGLNSMFGTAGMIIPIIAGVFLFDKAVAPMQFVGLGIFFLSARLLIGDSKAVYTNFNYKTLLLLIGALLANGGTMLAQQMFTEYVPQGDVSVFSFLSFAIIGVLSLALFGVLVGGNKDKRAAAKFPKMLIVCGVALAVAVFIINQLATLSTKLVSPVVLFTFINGGGTIISTLVAAVLYKERISIKSALGILLGITSLVLIKLFETA